ncbi:hypothetical protein mRhiFer1_008724 [Rhinolophus ferrumequinum]|uniref:Uncharacterized protein n=1 Tax=Rhinolophus ferrumequinum TaxID=59479 RepID=A0A7J7TRG0_RHIFE|nr:hypothetical protein mRhiFer1_008724 [Rhinolophus ferrumequinum]
MESDSGQEDRWPSHSVWCPVVTVLRSWTPKEGWEDMDGSPASVERTLQVLAEQLPEEAKVTAGHVGWMFLTALSLNTENALHEMAQVPDQVSQLEALEALVQLLEEGPHSGDSEAEAEEASGDNVVPNPQARPILKQRVKHEQHLGPGGVAAGNPAVTEFTTYTPYTPTELQELGRRYRQSPGEPVSAWLLRLWDEGADNILCSPGEMEKLAFVTVHPSLRQRLQNCHSLAHDQGNHSLMEWLTAAVHTVWGQAGEVPDTVIQWQSYMELTQIIREMGMRHAIFNPNMRGPDDKLFTASMRDLVLDTAPASAFGSLLAILTPYVGRRIHEVTIAMATLGDVEIQRQRKLRQEVRAVVRSQASESNTRTDVAQSQGSRIDRGKK